MKAMSTILVIDDDPGVRESLRSVLEDWGYRVRLAADGQAGIDAALARIPDLIIVDMMMPRASGFTVLDRLRNQHHLSVPIVMLSGNGNEPQRSLAAVLGADRFLNKPVHAEELQNVLSELLAVSPSPVA